MAQEAPELVLLFPGQGSQKPGMGKDLADAFEPARVVFDTVDAALGTPLSRLCFEGPAEELTLTHNAQPALLAHGAAAWAAIKPHVGDRAVAAAGHSLGEFTAYHAAGALELTDGVCLVRRRGELMYETGTARPGTMAAILGDVDDATIDDVCQRATSEVGTVVAANYNSPGQIVISGEVAAVERAMELAKEAGAKRAIRLNVSGAFHSPLMQPAVDGLREALEFAHLHDGAFPVVANVDASHVTDGATAERLLLRQLTSPVRWSDVVRELARSHPHALFVELGPGAVLTGLVKKIAPDVQTAPCGTRAEVEALLARVA
jgi:[acyl-carrier-protein] S-malonyltransferase